MAPNGWASPSETELLTSLLPEYEKCQVTKHYKPFWTMLYSRFLSLSPLIDTLFPGRTLHELSEVEMAEYSLRLEKLQTRLREWYRWRCNVRSRKVAVGIPKKILKSIYSPRTRGPKAYEAYAKLFPDEVHAAQEARFEAGEGSGKNGLQNWHAICQDLYASASDEKLQAIDDYVETTTNDQRLDSEDKPKDPKRYLQILPAILKAAIEPAVRKVDLMALVTLVGPVPESNGKISAWTLQFGDKDDTPLFASSWVDHDRVYVEAVARFAKRHLFEVEAPTPKDVSEEDLSAQEKGDPSAIGHPIPALSEEELSTQEKGDPSAVGHLIPALSASRSDTQTEAPAPDMLNPSCSAGSNLTRDVDDSDCNVDRGPDLRLPTPPRPHWPFLGVSRFDDSSLIQMDPESYDDCSSSASSAMALTTPPFLPHSDYHLTQVSSSNWRSTATSSSDNSHASFNTQTILAPSGSHLTDLTDQSIRTTTFHSRQLTLLNRPSHFPTTNTPFTPESMSGPSYELQDPYCRSTMVGASQAQGYLAESSIIPETPFIATQPIVHTPGTDYAVDDDNETYLNTSHSSQPPKAPKVDSRTKDNLEIPDRLPPPRPVTAKDPPATSTSESEHLVATHACPSTAPYSMAPAEQSHTAPPMPSTLNGAHASSPAPASDMPTAPLPSPAAPTLLPRAPVRQHPEATPMPIYEHKLSVAENMNKFLKLGLSYSDFATARANSRPLPVIENPASPLIGGHVASPAPVPNGHNVTLVSLTATVPAPLQVMPQKPPPTTTSAATLALLDATSPRRLATPTSTPNNATPTSTPNNATPTSTPSENFAPTIKPPAPSTVNAAVHVASPAPAPDEPTAPPPIPANGPALLLPASHQRPPTATSPPITERNETYPGTFAGAPTTNQPSTDPAIRTPNRSGVNDGDVASSALSSTAAPPSNPNKPTPQASLSSSAPASAQVRRSERGVVPSRLNPWTTHSPLPPGLRQRQTIFVILHSAVSGSAW
ncbi:hypothetical protein DFP72DRAFT_848995 [Ephemerocybe angulata]|uniref:Uncharacterized protein n=1 Tax=Ephemerocybe angulata TaxID=980116 RepID=A0A8H6HWC2_9AGAR|nr:hypothetical protein DFP72DRAFT_848995 [Tulosesus angulatus]